MTIVAVGSVLLLAKAQTAVEIRQSWVKSLRIEVFAPTPRGYMYPLLAPTGSATRNSWRTARQPLSIMFISLL